MPKIKNRWIAGRYNGEPIVGFEVRFIVDLGQLRIKRYWLPYGRWSLTGRFLIWLCFQVRLDARYRW